MQGNTRLQYQDLNQCAKIISDIAQNNVTLEAGLGNILTIICRRMGAPEITGTLVFGHDNDPQITMSYEHGTLRELDLAMRERGLIGRAKRGHTMEPPVSGLRQVRPEGYVQYSSAIQSEIAAPLLLADSCFGVIDVASSHNRAFQDEDQAWLQQIAALIQLAIAPELKPSQDIDVVLDTLLKTALEATQTDAYAVLVFADGDRVVPRRAALRQGGHCAPTAVVGGQDWSQQSGLTGRALRTGEEINVPDVDQRPDYLKHIAAVKSEVVIPVRGVRQEIIGALDIQSFKEDAFPAPVVNKLKSLIQQVSSALSVAQLSEKLNREQQVLERLARVAPGVVRNFALDAVYDLILEAAFSLLPTARMAQILTIKRHIQTDAQSLVRIHELPAPADRSENRPTRNGRCKEPLMEYSIERGITGRAVRRQITQNVPNVALDGDHIRLPTTTFSIVSELAVPILLGHDVIAVLNIESEALDGFSKRDQDVAELLAVEAGLAISNAQDYTRKIELLNIVVKATHEVFSNVDDSELLIATILKTVRQVCNAEDGYCGLILRDGDPKHVTEDDRLWVKSEIPSTIAAGNRREWTVKDGLTGRAIRDRTHVYLPNTAADSTYIPTLQGMLTDLAVPLFNSYGVPVGAFTLERPALDAFDQHAIDALELFGPPVVAALDKSDQMDTLRLRQKEIIDLIRQVAHLLSRPVETLQDELATLAGSSPGAPVQHVEAATRFLHLVLDWLVAQAEVLGQTGEEPRHDHVEVHTLVADALDAYRYYADRKVVALVDETPQATVFAHVNRTELLGSVVELLVNAVKYSPPAGKVHVRVTQIFHDVLITVEDEGPGVPESEQARIFGRGTRGSNVISETKGSGLGLYFVHQAIKRQHGSVGVESPVTTVNGLPRGSRFFIRIPAANHAE